MNYWVSIKQKSVRFLYKKAIALSLLLLGTALYIGVYQPSLLVNTLNQRDFEAKKFSAFTIDIDRWNVRYFKTQDWDPKKPVLIFVHGFRSSSSFWLPYLEHFSDFNHIVLDLPTHGQTSYVRGFSHDLRNYGRFLELFCDALNLDNLYLIGTSMGGGAVLSFAGQTSRNIKAIAVSNPLAIMPPKLSIVHEELFKGNNLLLPKTRSGVQRMQEVVFGRLLNLSLFRSELLYFVMQENRGRFLEAFRQMQDEGGVDDLLERIDAPVFLIQGDRDKVVDPSCAPVEKKLIPNCELFWVNEGPHVFLGVQLSLVISHMQDFFRQH